MAKIAFLGLGEMGGTPMASRLLRAGHDVVVWNRSPERTVALAQQGAVVASSPAKAAAGSDFVITMLATRTHSSRCCLEPGNWLPRFRVARC
jgi:3-hydroxyisobutyrate dehydrogenase-like beta-hydroxyacid dehydrogenase